MSSRRGTEAEAGGKLHYGAARDTKARVDLLKADWGSFTDRTRYKLTADLAPPKPTANFTNHQRCIFPDVGLASLPGLAENHRAGEPWRILAYAGHPHVFFKTAALCPTWSRPNEITRIWSPYGDGTLRESQQACAGWLSVHCVGFQGISDRRFFRGSRVVLRALSYNTRSGSRVVCVQQR